MYIVNEADGTAIDSNATNGIVEGQWVGGGGGTEGEVGERKLYEEGPDFLIGSPLSTA